MTHAKRRSGKPVLYRLSFPASLVVLLSQISPYPRQIKQIILLLFCTFRSAIKLNGNNLFLFIKDKENMPEINLSNTSYIKSTGPGLSLNIISLFENILINVFIIFPLFSDINKIRCISPQIINISISLIYLLLGRI